MPELLEFPAKAICIDKALAIEGFMHPRELEWLAKEAGTHKRIAEVGSYYGRSTRAICDHALGEVHAYDDFFGPRDLAMDYRKRMKIFSKFQENLKEHIDSGILHIHDEDHALLQPEGFYDMIFIDGGHKYPDIKRDLEKWMPAVADKGMICGHDYDLGYPGILRALSEAFEKGQVQVVPETTIWYAVAQ